MAHIFSLVIDSLSNCLFIYLFSQVEIVCKKYKYIYSLLTPTSYPSFPEGSSIPYTLPLIDPLVCFESSSWQELTPALFQWMAPVGSSNDLENWNSKNTCENS